MRFHWLFLLLVLPWGCSSPRDAAETEASLRDLARSRLAQIDGAAAVGGIEKPVEILRDKWGVAHIYAETEHDLFFAQGWTAAQDRLYQIEIWRRTGTGELAEVFGPEYVERDRIARLVDYRGDMEAEWASYGPNSEAIANAFTDGVNAWVRAHRDSLPIEFELLGFEPGEWQPRHVTLRIAGLMMVRNARNEIARTEMAARLGLEKTAKYLPPDPPAPLRPDPLVDLAGLDERVLEGYNAAVSIPRLEMPEEGVQGSNNWVVDGRLSATGKPILASDPHRPVILPSLRYLVHLNGAGWNVIGAGEPALPGVAIGHNERAGWGFTIVPYDAADLYVEKLDPENPRRYEYRGEWFDMEVERQTIQVRGAEPAEVELAFTRHGPLIWEDPGQPRAVALRWAGQEPGTAGYLGSLAVDRVSNWDEFLAAMERWKVPAENIVYADVHGDIGWAAAGILPIRENWKGLFPVPGWTGEYRWGPFRPVAQLPKVKNPASGYVATANQNIRPRNYPHDLAFDWAAPYRFNRVDEVLRAGKGFTVDDFKKLQHDETSLPARELVGLLAELPESGAGAANEARRLLEGWDFVLSKDSAPAALFEVWLQKLRPKYAASQEPPATQDFIAGRIGMPELIGGIRELTGAERSLVMSESLAEAWEETERLLGGDPAGWRWGALHTVEFRHPLANTPERAAAFNLGPVERGGDGFTPNATGGSGYRQSSGASYRQVLDFADWDRSVFTSTPGQSGQPESPFYNDLLPKWAAGEYLPLLFTRAAVEANTAHRLILEPME